MEPLRRLSLNRRAPRAQAEDRYPERLQLFVMISERAGLRRASSGVRNLIPALGRFFIRPARARVTLDDGSSTQGCEVHDASGGDMSGSDGSCILGR